MAQEPTFKIVVAQQSGFSGALGGVTDNAKDAFDALGSMLSDAIGPFRKILNESLDSANEVELRLDLAFTGGGNWIVVSASGSATLSVKLVWKR